MRRWIIICLWTLGMTCLRAADSCVVLVVDGIRDELTLREGLTQVDCGTLGSLMASPEAGMRRAALLSGKDALVAGVWGNRAAHLRLQNSLFPVLEKRGIRSACAGAWGLGFAAPCDLKSHGLIALEGAFFGRKRSSLTSRINPIHGEPLENWIKQEGPLLIYHSLDWEGGSASELKQCLQRYENLGIEHFVVIGGGAAAPIWWSWKSPTPKQCTEVLARVEDLWLDGEPIIKADSIEFGTRHLGSWPGLRFDKGQRHRGLVTFNREWLLFNGKTFYERKRYDAGERVDVFREKTDDAVPLLRQQEAWWLGVRPSLKQAVAYRIPQSGSLKLSVEDWEASGKRPGSLGWPVDGPIEISDLERVMDQLRGPENTEFEDLCGSWSLDVPEAGVYEFKLSFLPEGVGRADLASCQPGQLELLVGRTRSRIEVFQGAKAFTLRLRLPAGRARAEATLSGQTGDENGLISPFFFEVKQVQER